MDPGEDKWLFPSRGCSKCVISLNPALGDGHYCHRRKRKLRRGEMSQQVENVDWSPVSLTPEPAFCPPLHVASGGPGNIKSCSRSSFLLSGSGLQWSLF